MKPASNGNNSETKRLLGFPCGCDSRKAIMGAGNWQTDALIIGIAILAPLTIYAYFKWGRSAES